MMSENINPESVEEIRAAYVRGAAEYFRQTGRKGKLPEWIEPHVPLAANEQTETILMVGPVVPFRALP